MTTSIKDAAKAMIDKGYCVFPCKQTKQPAVRSWTELKDNPEKRSKVRFNGHTRMAVATGLCSGGLELIDIDDPSIFEDFLKKIPDVKDKVLLEKSPNGYHVAFKSQHCGRNQKLAVGEHLVDSEGEYEWNNKTTLIAKQSREDKKWYVRPLLIETRGEGGYFLCYPSIGYELLNEMGFEDLPELTEEERTYLMEAATSFDETSQDTPTPTPTSTKTKTLTPDDRPWSPGHHFNAEGEPREILEDAGWTEVKTKSNSNSNSSLWRRPGKTLGISGELFVEGLFQNYSTSVPELETECQYTPFELLSALRFDGDFSEAAKWVVNNYDCTLTKEQAKDVIKGWSMSNPEHSRTAQKIDDLRESLVEDSELSREKIEKYFRKNNITTSQSHPHPQFKRRVIKYDPLQKGECTRKVDAALIRGKGTNELDYYTYLGEVVYITSDNKICQYDQENMELRIEELVEIQMKKKSGSKFKWREQPCPINITKKILKYRHTKRDKIYTTCSHPLVTEYGKVFGLQNGLENGVLFPHSGNFEVARDLSFRECYDILVKDLCQDMLFKDKSLGEAVYISWLMNMIFCQAIPGGSPPYIFMANEMGTGKSTAIDIGMWLLFGKSIASGQWAGGSEEELNKALTASLRAGEEAIVFDNIPQNVEINLPYLAQIITSGKFKGRILGQSTNFEADFRRPLVLGGNNLTMSGEWSRRAIVVLLETPTANAAERTVINPNIERTVLKNRKKYLSYLLRMCELAGEKRGYRMEKDSDRTKGINVGTFWDVLVKDTLMDEVKADILQAMGSKIENASGEQETLIEVVELLKSLADKHAWNQFTARQIFDICNSVEDWEKGIELDTKDAITQINANAFRSIKSFAKAIKTVCNRPIASGLVMKAVNRGSTGVKYEVRACKKTD